MRVLVTRPRHDAEAFAALLHARGHTTIIEPLIDIDFRSGPPLDLKGVQAIALTSANGARATAARTPARDIRIIAVGPATAAEAKVLGFRNVDESPGEGVNGLAAHIAATLKPTAGAILHATGTVTAGDLKAALPAFTVRTAQIYEAHAAQTLSGAVTTELTAGLIDAVTLFSPRTATLFATLIQNTGLEPACGRVQALCLSAAVANALAPLAFRRVQTAEKPTAAALLDLLAP
ncbi:MAG: uroporphyrinogen-III synthase [Alphaproteobacteria bacterium]|nr:uroporphyrinogen-III synthase [Alphaproteobacteria bacterium]